MKLIQLSGQTISRLSQLFKNWPIQKKVSDELLQQFNSDLGLLARSVTNVEAENMQFAPRIYQRSNPTLLKSLTLLTKIEEGRVRYPQYLLTRSSCQPAIHFYNDTIPIDVIHHRDIGLSQDEPKKIQREQVAEKRKELVALIRKNKGDVETRGKHWLTGGAGERLNEICAYLSPLQRTAYGVQLNQAKNPSEMFFEDNVSINQLIGNQLMHKVGELKGILDMFYSGIEHASIYGEHKPYLVYGRGELIPYQPTAEDVAAFLKITNEVLISPAFYAIYSNPRDNYHNCALAFFDSVKAIEQAGQLTLNKTAWKFGLFGRALYATGKLAADLLQNQTDKGLSN